MCNLLSFKQDIGSESRRKGERSEMTIEDLHAYKVADDEQ
jgi:hypothetical protein